MLIHKMRFLDQYCLESSRRFHLESVNPLSSSFYLTWRRKHNQGVWHLNKEGYNSRQCSSEQLISILYEEGVCLTNFENKLTNYLLNYAAFMLDATNDLATIIKGYSIDSAQANVVNFADHLFDLIENTLSSNSGKNTPSSGYDLSDISLNALLQPSFASK
ncbi:MAG: hypothetical protein OXC44_00875 [Proteobacteria bacterium]|nr:hypothetical protein [Pseudomonadota bacterium]